MESTLDKKTIGAFAVIAVIVFVWLWKFSPQPQPETKKPGDTVASVPKTDTVAHPTPPPPQQQAPLPDTSLTQFSDTTHRYVVIESPMYKAILNTKGGTLARFQLKNYKKWDGVPVQLICDSVGFAGTLGIDYTAPDGKPVSTDGANFTIDAQDSVSLKENDSITVTARLLLSGDSASMIEKKFVFHGNSYGIGLDVTMKNMEKFLSQKQYAITWKKGLKYQEHNSVEESGRSHAFISVNEDARTIDAPKPEEPVKQVDTGTIAWTGMKTKYFGAAIIPGTPLQRGTAEVRGNSAHADSSGLVESYNLSMTIPYSQPVQTQHFTVFVGPLEYKAVKHYGLEAMIEFGWKLVVRPIGEFFMLPILRFVHSFISNWGIVIILFSLLIRMLLWPLSIPQIKSSRKMQLLQPKIAEIKAKNNGDQQKTQMETMALYREYGINPLGGCLPLLLQMPILYALYGTLSSVIDLRQANFGLWIHDLSIPDALIHLPTSIPLLGSQISGLALVMGITMFIQQRMIVTDPSQKAMVYFMPIMLTLMFNYLPSGLNLYYFTFNLLSIGQQLYLTKFSRNPMTLEQLRREASQKKKGWFSQKMEEAQKMAQLQQQQNKKK